MNRLFNDGSKAPPALRVYLNLANLEGLPAWSSWKPVDPAPRDARLRAEGFEGVQLTDDAPPAAGATLPYCGLGRVNVPAEADPLIARRADRGDQCLTLHVGWGTESDADIDRLVEAVLSASEKHRLPTFIETHRATITQDLWRTVELTKRFPEIRFNADFSHYYCGQELVYGEWKDKLAFMQPIFDRTAFMHGRVASPGCMQVPVGGIHRRPTQAHGVADYLQHFRELWTRAMSGFRKSAGPGDVLIFAPELLEGTYYYARLFPDAEGQLVEESDRFAEAKTLAQLARECFEQSAKS